MSKILHMCGLGVYPHCIPRDVVTFVLFPYLLPSLPVCKNEFWLKGDIRSILEHLLVFYCRIPMEKIEKLLETFVTRILSISSSYGNRNLNRDLSFLADIESRCSFTKFDKWRSSVYSLYACTVLIENKVNIHEDDDCALMNACREGHKDIVALLLEHKADVHVHDDSVLFYSSKYGYKDIVAMLLEHEANVHTCGAVALRLASCNGHKDTVALLLEHKADVHAWNDAALRLASMNGYKDIVALLLQHKADISCRQ
jgi:hypothetical protein